MEFSFVGEESTECLLLIKPNRLAETENELILKDLHTEITVLSIRKGFTLIWFFPQISGFMHLYYFEGY